MASLLVAVLPLLLLLLVAAAVAVVLLSRRPASAPPAGADVPAEQVVCQAGPADMHCVYETTQVYT